LKGLLSEVQSQKKADVHKDAEMVLLAVVVVVVVAAGVTCFRFVVAAA